MKISVEPVINLLHAAHFSALATHSTAVPGYPYVTVVPNVLDEAHRPILLVSTLAEHTRNLQIDRRVSLLVTEPNSLNPQTAARLSLVGDVEPFEPDEFLRKRYLRYVLDAEQYVQLDFLFFRIQPKRIRYIAGIGKMGWVEAAEFLAAPSVVSDIEHDLIQSARTQLPNHIRIMGIDPFGIDYEADGFRDRFAFEEIGDLDTQVTAAIPQLS